MAALTEFEKLLQNYQRVDTPSQKADELSDLERLIQGYENKSVSAPAATPKDTSVSGADIFKFIPPASLAGVVGGADAGVVGGPGVVAGATPPASADALDALNLYTKQFQGKDYSLDTATVDKLTQQILAQNLTSKWSGEGFGSAQANAKAMAENLYASGVKDIKDVGLVDIKADAVITPKYEYVHQGGTDEYGTPIPTAKIIGYVDQYGNPVDASLAREEVLYSGGDSGTSESVYMAPVGTRKIIGNKATGQSLLNDYGERGGVDNAWSGTYAGKGNTAYRVKFDDQGNPYFYTTGASSNDLVNLLGNDPILNAVAQIGAAYFGPMGTVALNAAMGKDPKDIAKSYILSQLGQEAFKGLTDTGIDTNTFGETGANFAKDIQDIFGKTGADIVGKTAGQYVAGEGKVNIENLLINQGVGAATNAVLGEIPGFNGLNATEKRFVTNIVSSTLNDGKLSPGEAINAALTYGTQAMKTTSKATKVADASTDVDGEFQLPPGVQLASASTDTMSDAGNSPYRVEATGTPIFAGDRRASTVNVPFDSRLMSIDEEIESVDPATGRTVYTKPEGAYYDPVSNAWLVRQDITQLLGSGQFANDISLFRQSQGDLDQIAATTSDKSDDYIASFLKSMGINNADDLAGSPFSDEQILDIIKNTTTGDGLPELVMTASRPIGTVGALDTVLTPDEEVPELVMTAPRPIGTIGTLDTVPTPTNVVTTTPPATTPVTTPKVTSPKVTPPKVTTPTKKTADTDTPASEAKNAPSQDPYANIKLMEELFGGDLAYKLRALGAPKNLASADIDALARLLRG